MRPIALLLAATFVLSACTPSESPTTPDAAAVTDAGSTDAATADASGDAASPFRTAFKLPPVTDPHGRSCLADLKEPTITGVGNDTMDRIPQGYFFHEIAKQCRPFHPELAEAADSSANLTEPARARILFRAARASVGWDFRCALTVDDADQAFMYVWPRLQATNDTRAPSDQCLAPAIPDACSFDVGTWAFLKTLGMLENARHYHDQENETPLARFRWLSSLQGLGTREHPRNRCPWGLPTDEKGRVPPGFVPPPTDGRKLFLHEPADGWPPAPSRWW